MITELAAGLDHGRLLFEAIQQKREGRWEQIAGLLARVPETLDGAGLGLADEVAFALGQLGRFADAIPLLERAWAAQPNHRRASALAYLHYAWLMKLNTPGDGGRSDRKKSKHRRRPGSRAAIDGRPAGDNAGSGTDTPTAADARPALELRAPGEPRGGDDARRDLPPGTPPPSRPRPVPVPRPAPADKADLRERLRLGFRRWIGEALKFDRGSIKDLYRLGIFEAQLEARHDAVALHALLSAIQSYHRMDPAQRERRHDLRKYYVRALYAAGRSALRLRRAKLARRLSFACIREDKQRDFVEPVHKLGLAAKVCLAMEELDHAERAARLALDAKGPPRRDYLYGLLAEVSHRRKDLPGAARWIEAHVPEHRRSAALWRQLGDLRSEAADADGALGAWRNALLRDRTGRHLTLGRIGDAERRAGRLREAERAYNEALEFRRRRFLSDDLRALHGLIEVQRALGHDDRVRELRRRLAEASPTRNGSRENVA